MRHLIMSPSTVAATALLLVTSGMSCGDSAVSNDDPARRAYLGIDSAIDKAISLGLQGFNTALSPNISPQTAAGGVMGTLVVGGRVDRGSGPNRGMSLTTTFTMYEDLVPSPEDSGTIDVVYDGQASSPTLNLSLRGIPNGTFTGTFVQTLHLSGNLSGDVYLNLMLSGSIRAAGSAGSMFERTPGTMSITGTAMSSYGSRTVNLMR